MRYSVMRFRASAVFASLALAATCLSGCGRFKPSGESEALSLLKSGSNQVCSASEVQSLLRAALLPNPIDLQINGDEADKRKALDSISFNFSEPVLISIDKANSKASCKNKVEIRGTNNASNTYALNYTVSPSPDQSGSTAVVINGNDAKFYTLNIVYAAAPAAPTALADTQGDGEEDGPAPPKVDEASLVGVWIKTRQPGAACRSGNAITFQPDHVITGGLGAGRWALTDNNLHLVTDASRTADVTASITAADAISLTLSMPGNAVLKLRRCSNEDLQSPAVPPAPAPSTNDQTPGATQ